jgi:hypothetical protein
MTDTIGSTSPATAFAQTTIGFEHDREPPREWIPTIGFEHDREPPREWIEELRRLSPKSDEVGWLYLAWEPGDPWIHGQRWVLYEMLHEKFVDDDILDELRGPHPRSAGHMCTSSVKVPTQFQCHCRLKRECWVGGPCSLITLAEWKMWRRTGGHYYAKPFWIIQGQHGGHKWHFNKFEQILCRQANLKDTPPALSALPYAPFDRRVTQQIVRHNRLMQLDATLSEYKRIMGAGYGRYKHALERDMRREYIGYLEEQMRESQDLFISAARKGEMDDRPKTTVDWDRVEPVATQHYIDTGNVLHPSQVIGGHAA